MYFHLTMKGGSQKEKKEQTQRYMSLNKQNLYTTCYIELLKKHAKENIVSSQEKFWENIGSIIFMMLVLLCVSKLNTLHSWPFKGKIGLLVVSTCETGSAAEDVWLLVWLSGCITADKKWTASSICMNVSTFESKSWALSGPPMLETAAFRSKAQYNMWDNVCTDWRHKQRPETTRTENCLRTHHVDIICFSVSVTASSIWSHVINLIHWISNVIKPSGTLSLNKV